MGTIIRWMLAIFLTCLAIAALQTGLKLIDVAKEEGAIEVHFLSFDIHNQVNPENITSYTIAFFAGALVAAMLAISFIREALSRLRGNN
ncbi:hypothetical protein NSQ77_02170 [Oceanobacillus sp. FSL K6-2867]|uniref:hypothetical protein n=1 Tax=Oceanobacillus sp. FSL K6-2867 TaxID=2954748 RepID=UPI0030D91423